MSDLALYLGAIILGYIAGSLVRKKKDAITWTGKVQIIAITVLVLGMGARMGANREITDNLKDIGLYAFIMTAGVMACTVATIYLVRKLMGMDKYGRVINKRSQTRDAAGADAETATDDACSAESASAAEAGAFAAAETESFGAIETESFGAIETESLHAIEEDEKKQGAGSMTIIILISIFIGMLFGYFVIRDAFADNMEVFEYGAGILVKVGLVLLLFFIGVDLGIEGTLIENFKSAGLRIMVFPLAIIIGTLIGALAMGLLLGMGARESLAIGAGFGWYTLAPGIIMEAGYMTASAVSFLHNVMRELASIIFIPLVAKKIGYLESTGMAGAASMDVCLPIVEKATRSDIAIYAFVSGFVLSILVPVIVPLIIG